MPEKSQAGYHPLQVRLHWLIVLLVFTAFVLGKFMSGQPDEADKIPLIGLHMALGFATLIAMVVRMVVCLRLTKPSPVSIGNSILDNVAKIVHGAIYLFVLLMAVSGLSLSMQSGLILMCLAAPALPYHQIFTHSIRASCMGSLRQPCCS